MKATVKTGPRGAAREGVGRLSVALGATYPASSPAEAGAGSLEVGRAKEVVVAAGETTEAVVAATGGAKAATRKEVESAAKEAVAKPSTSKPPAKPSAEALAAIAAADAADGAVKAEGDPPHAHRR